MPPFDFLLQAIQILSKKKNYVSNLFYSISALESLNQLLQKEETSF